jgi:hypothetical protein
MRTKSSYAALHAAPIAVSTPEWIARAALERLDAAA